MLFLTFYLNSDRYGLAARDIARILPYRGIRRQPGLSYGVIGFLEHANEYLPVIDLALATLERESKPLLSTRLALVRCEEVRQDKPIAALVLERATATESIAEDQFREPLLAERRHRFLGKLARVGNESVQWVETQHLITPDLLHQVKAAVEAQK
jgi:chemotaxis-related protein WspB